MKALAIAHDEVSLPGMLGERAAERGVDLDLVIPDRGDRFPSTRAFDFLLVMGAPWSLDDPGVAHWVEPELELLGEAVRAEVPVLGICFGAQALAAVLGGRVGPCSAPTIGWQTVESLRPDLVHPGPWLHWHGDAFSLPPGARLLARDRTGPQAYAYGPHLAVQFHPEATRDLIAPWVELSRDALRDLGIDGDDLLDETERRAVEARPHTERILDAFLEGVAVSGAAGGPPAAPSHPPARSNALPPSPRAGPPRRRAPEEDL